MVISNKYSDFINVFSKKSAVKLFKYFNINKYRIDLKFYKQSLYKPIHILGIIKLKILKKYFEINLSNGFIWLSKFFGRADILLN